MMFLKNLPIRFKLLTLLVLPMVLALFFIFQGIFESYDKYDSTLKAGTLSQLSVSGSFLVHELQKERGASAVYLGSKGDRFSSKLVQQRENTSKALFNFKQRTDTFDSRLYPNRVRDEIKNISNQLTRMEQIRQQISNLNINPEIAIGYYTELNNKILSLSYLLQIW